MPVCKNCGKTYLDVTPVDVGTATLAEIAKYIGKLSRGHTQECIDHCLATMKQELTPKEQRVTELYFRVGLTS